MQTKTSRLFYLSLLVVFFTSACTSTVKAPVDSRNKTPSAEKQVSYSKNSDAIPSLEEKRDYHLVAKGDTLYSIAWRYGYDYRDVARWNDIAGNFVIYPGQRIRLNSPPGRPDTLKAGPITARKKKTVEATNKVREQSRATTKSKKGIKPKQSKRYTSKVVWRWPTKGKLVKLNTPTSKKGVDIAGRAGQKIDAAAAGDVVYSGSGLLGYGKLIIIKHSDTFLSAYAHNEKLYAKEGDKVKAGQKIATMGLGNKGKPILHFEIRKDGTPVNPLQHLPKS